MNDAAATVPATMPAIISHRRLTSARTLGPANSCQTFVTNDGNSSIAAACAGSISVPSTPMATVGRPMPVTPLTKPATHERRGNHARAHSKGRDHRNRVLDVMSAIFDGRSAAHNA